MGGGVVTLLFFGGATTQGREPERPADEALVAGAGPTASLLVAIAFMALIVVGEALEGAVGDAISQVAVVVALLNLLLALLNLLPVYPLDGGRILHAALWAATGEEMRASRGVAIASRVLGWGLFGLGVGVMLTGDGVTALMLVACGWLLGGMARSVERRVALEGLLRGVSVESVMERDLPAVAPQLTLDTFAAQYLATGEGTSLPVMRDDMLLGLIGISQLRGIRRSAWPTMHAADVMVSPPSAAVAGARRRGVGGSRIPAPDGPGWAACAQGQPAAGRADEARHRVGHPGARAWDRRGAVVTSTSVRQEPAASRLLSVEEVRERILATIGGPVESEAVAVSDAPRSRPRGRRDQQDRPAALGQQRDGRLRAAQRRHRGRDGGRSRTSRGWRGSGGRLGADG